MSEKELLIPKRGGYRKLKSFQMAQLAYDMIVRFCNRDIDERSRTHDSDGGGGSFGSAEHCRRFADYRNVAEIFLLTALRENYILVQSF